MVVADHVANSRFKRDFRSRLANDIDGAVTPFSRLHRNLRTLDATVTAKPWTSKSSTAIVAKLQDVVNESMTRLAEPLQAAVDTQAANARRSSSSTVQDQGARENDCGPWKEAEADF